MTVEPEVQALEIVKQLEALCNQAESAIKETDALFSKGGVSREAMDQAFGALPESEKSKGRAQLSADLEEIEQEVNAARQSLTQVQTKTSASMKRMRRMI
ncbi:hypothetical protein [Thalassospira sp.]|uniref:hypothetical protein n=1 Tax=Thalassospira sp. TaxID=1912094 RepID=UPI000C6556E8|nr:hypothetical protein [Thalassospira sp.]MBC05425.1 hypothetical protein [Thalassospira sp.]|tara:strand:- start:21851 stop:22150 length:300 start_codon:yes stop_codon:yes gene_type:complete